MRKYHLLLLAFRNSSIARGRGPIEGTVNKLTNHRRRVVKNLANYYTIRIVSYSPLQERHEREEGTPRDIRTVGSSMEIPKDPCPQLHDGATARFFPAGRPSSSFRSVKEELAAGGLWEDGEIK